MSALKSLIRDVSEVFTYRHGRGGIYDACIWSKTVFLLSTSISIAIYVDKAIDAAIALTILLIFAVLSMDRRKLLRCLRSLTIFIAFLYIFVLLYTLIPLAMRGELSTKTLVDMAIGFARFVALSIPFILVFTSTRASSYVRLFQWFGVPYRYTYVLPLSIRFLAVLLHDLQQIYDIQRVRGLDLGRGSLIQRAKALLHIIVPLTMVSLDRVDDTCLSMEIRGFGKFSKRTFLYEEKMRIIDLELIALSITITILSIAI